MTSRRARSPPPRVARSGQCRACAAPSRRRRTLRRAPTTGRTACARRHRPRRISRRFRRHPVTRLRPLARRLPSGSTVLPKRPRLPADREVRTQPRRCSGRRRSQATRVPLGAGTPGTSGHHGSGAAWRRRSAARARQPRRKRRRRPRTFVGGPIDRPGPRPGVDSEHAAEPRRLWPHTSSVLPGARASSCCLRCPRRSAWPAASSSLTPATSRRSPRSTITPRARSRASTARAARSWESSPSSGGRSFPTKRFPRGSSRRSSRPRTPRSSSTSD